MKLYRTPQASLQVIVAAPLLPTLAATLLSTFAAQSGCQTYSLIAAVTFAAIQVYTVQVTWTIVVCVYSWTWHYEWLKAYGELWKGMYGRGHI